MSLSFPSHSSSSFTWDIPLHLALTLSRSSWTCQLSTTRHTHDGTTRRGPCIVRSSGGLVLRKKHFQQAGTSNIRSGYLDSTHHKSPPATASMCYQLIELYSACRCLYYQHAIDRCAAFGQPGHGVQRRTILVGYACSDHSQSHRAYAAPPQTYSDSGYYSHQSSSSHRSSSRSQYR